MGGSAGVALGEVTGRLQIAGCCWERDGPWRFNARVAARPAHVAPRRAAQPHAGANAHGAAGHVRPEVLWRGLEQPAVRGRPQAHRHVPGGQVGRGCLAGARVDWFRACRGNGWRDACLPSACRHSHPPHVVPSPAPPLLQRRAPVHQGRHRGRRHLGGAHLLGQRLRAGVPRQAVRGHMQGRTRRHMPQPALLGSHGLPSPAAASPSSRDAPCARPAGVYADAAWARGWVVETMKWLLAEERAGRIPPVAPPVS